MIFYKKYDIIYIEIKFYENLIFYKKYVIINYKKKRKFNKKKKERGKQYEQEN